MIAVVIDQRRERLHADWAGEEEGVAVLVFKLDVVEGLYGCRDGGGRHRTSTKPKRVNDEMLGQHSSRDFLNSHESACA